MSQPIYDATTESTHVLDTMQSPGVVTFSGHDQKWKWDVQAASGQSGATSRLVGDELPQFQASYFLASPEDQIAWAAFQRLLESAVVPTARSLVIYHPDLARNHIVEVSVQSIGGWVRDERGGVTVLVQYIVNRPPKSKAAKGATGKGGSAAPPGGSGSDEYDPNAERKRELDELLNSYDDPGTDGMNV